MNHFPPPAARYAPALLWRELCNDYYSFSLLELLGTDELLLQSNKYAD
jgi:hypothetical protein